MNGRDPYGINLTKAMKTLSLVSTCALLAAGMAAADVPKKIQPSQYAHLWNSSPFTSKPPPPPPPDQVSAFEDWVLSGISEVNGGYFVSLKHKKNQNESQVIKPDRTIKYYADHAEEILPGASGAFKVDKVEYSKEGWTKTVVHLTSGGRSGTVKFDDKALVPKNAAPQRGQHGGNPNQPGGNPNQPGGNPNQPQQAQPNQPQNQQPAQQANPGVRPPRPRGNR